MARLSYPGETMQIRWRRKVRVPFSHSIKVPSPANVIYCFYRFEEEVKEALAIDDRIAKSYDHNIMHICKVDGRVESSV
jgi:hypothetical protein